MKLILDTHVLLWFLSSDSKIPNYTLREIEIADVCYVSMATLWEIAIKVSLRKLELDYTLSAFIKLISESGFKILPISASHVVNVANLQFHHRDPFDRLIIAQALTEDLRLVSQDAAFADYKVKLLWQ